MPKRTPDPGQAVIACHARPRRPKKPSAVRKLSDLAEPLIEYPVTFGAWCEATGYDPETRTYQEAVSA